MIRGGISSRHKQCDSGCNQCKFFSETVGNFTDYFQKRNSIEKPMLDDYNLGLIDERNKDWINWRSMNRIPTNVVLSKEPVRQPLNLTAMRPPTSASDVLRLSPNGTYFTKKSSIQSDSIDNSSIRPVEPSKIPPVSKIQCHPDITIHSDQKPINTAIEETKQSENLEKKLKLEKKLQETSLKLQNIYDNLESLKLDSNMYFSKLKEFLEQ